MKVVLIVGIAIAIAAAVGAAYFAFSGLAVSQSTAQAIFETAVERSANLSSYSVEYNITNSIQVASNESVIQGTMSILKNADSEKISLRMQSSALPEDIDAEVYTLPDGVFSCSTGLGGVVCERSNETLSVPDPTEQLASVRQMVDEGFIRMQQQGSRTVLGRTCDVIRFDYDISKLFSNLSLGAEAASAIKEMTATMCIDSQTGIPTDYEMSMKIEAEASAMSLMRMTATSLELTAPEITLPENATIY